MMRNYVAFDITKAIQISVDAHKGQKYGDHAYFYHPMMVAYYVAGGEFGIEYIVTAYLHDAVEDSDYTVDDIRHFFGDEIGDAVEAISKKSDDEDYEEYLERVVTNKIATVVKYYDLYHNHIVGERDTEKYRNAWKVISEKANINKKPMDYLNRNVWES